MHRHRWLLALGLVGAGALAALGVATTVSTVASTTSAAPSSWTMDAGGPEHNAVFDTAGAASTAGHAWRFAEVHAIALTSPPPETNVVGRLRASVRTTQTLGNALGVSVVGSSVYAESDSGVLYKLDAATGRMVWSSTFVNEAMGNPIVVGSRVYVGLGNSDFSYRELVAFKQGRPVMRGTGLSGVVAVSARSGKVLWTFPTRGEDMPTPAYARGVLYEADGSGSLFALNALTGRLLWRDRVGGFDSMSSPVVWQNPALGVREVVASFSDPTQVVAVNGATGAILWRQTIPGAFDTGVGDEMPAVSPSRGIVVVNSVVDPQQVGSTMTANIAVEALSAQTGKVLWTTLLGRGSMPPAFKAGVPMIAGSTIYMNAPATDTMHAISLTTGKVLWSFRAGFPGRAAPALVGNVLYFGDGPDIFALDARTGRLLARYRVGGLFGIVNPVVVGGTMYLDNSYNWVMALPLSRIRSATVR